MSRPFLLVSLAALLLMPAAARAEHGGEHDDDDVMEQPQPEPKADHGARLLKVMERRLKLTPEQRKKVESALKEGEPEQEQLQKEMKALREKMRKLMQKQHERVRAVLDDEQKWQFDEMMVRMRKRMQEGGRGRGRPQGPRRMPGPLEDDGVDHREPGPRDMPPPEMWHDRPAPSREPEGKR